MKESVYDMIFPLNKIIRKEWQESTPLGRATLLLRVPMAAVLTIFMWVVILLYPIILLMEKAEAWERAHRHWFTKQEFLP